VTQLAEGAIELPAAHLSARVPWHDTDWSGRVCASPGANNSCAVLRRVKEEKNTDAEEKNAGVPWGELERDCVPPCVFERAGFMRPKSYSIVREHAYAGGWTRSHAHFAETVHHMPEYSIEATPFRWVMRGEAPELARTWGIGYDPELEAAADEFIETSKPTNWIQDHRNQLALLDSFFAGVVPGRSLAFIYAKDVPLLEERQPGARVLIGVGQVTEVRPSVEWEYKAQGPVRSILWERAVCHSIRPSLGDGFLLPYHQLLSEPDLQGEDLSSYVALAPSDHFDEFSYVTERVGEDGAIAALSELGRVVDLLPGVADGSWDRVAVWLGDRLADTWEARGAYPGLGSALAAAGLERGPVVAHRVIDSLSDPAEDPWPALERAVADARRSTGPAAGLIGRMSRKAWERVTASEERYAMLKLLARFSLTSAQGRRLFDPEQRGVSDRELLENPYLLYELDRGADDAVGLATVDRGLFPQSAMARAALTHDPLPEPVEEAADDRRVRAACVAALERAAGEGHTVFDEPGLRRRLAAMELDPRCDPTSNQFEIAVEDFKPTLQERPLAGEGRAWQLERLAQATALIAKAVGTQIEEGPLDAETGWREAIDTTIEQPMPGPGDPDYALEEEAREEKARALKTLARSRIACLVGPAGTGKTTMLKALCSNPELAGNVLLLAPTGKSRVQLADKVGVQANTLAQFLHRAERWHWDRGYYLNPDGVRFGGFRTVIVDEASMLTEEMLAALIEALKPPERLILCGDHRQLPPIGAGRPFADLVAHLDELDAEPNGGGLAELSIGRRQQAGPGADLGRSRDDLAVANCFSSEQTPAGADQALARVVAGEGDGTLSVLAWEEEDELHGKIVELLTSDPELGLSAREADALKQSLGATGEYKGRPSFEFGSGGSGAERWQILSPVRSRVGGVAGLNRLVRRTWRGGDAATARNKKILPDPMGADEVLFDDKVMCVMNHHRKARDVKAAESKDGDVANGEIGMAVGWPKKNGKGIGLWIEFSTQAGLQFTFWKDELNSRKEASRELLEVAYAITVHKAQGSQFGVTFVVIPNPCPLLSPELLYTALTRHRERTILLVQGDPLSLLELADPARSETAGRLTCLFRAPDPFMTSAGLLLDGSHVHRSANGELMRSKSEVIVANTLRVLGIEYSYEELLHAPDGGVREPDFTIRRPGRQPVYWEHLGMLDLAGYRADWEAKLGWYAEQDILPWTEGGGSAGSLVWSTEGQGSEGIDAEEIERLAKDVFGSG
jgi:AAA domain/UvrD-like helicase C-terminal domain